MEKERFELVPMCNKNDIWYGLFDNLEKEYVTDRLCGNYKNIYDKLNELAADNKQIEDKIDEKITLLTDTKIKSFQNEDEVLLGKIKFGIQILMELKEVFE